VHEVATDASCRKCDMSDETSSHIILECEAIMRGRLQLFGDYRLENCCRKKRSVGTSSGGQLIRGLKY
jgi:hypothetical protein